MSFNISADNLTQASGDADNLGNTFTTNSSSEPPYYEFFDVQEFLSQFRFQLEIFLWKYMTFVVTFISSFGNLTIVLVLAQRKSRNFSTSIFIISLAVADFCVCLNALEGWLIVNLYIEPTYSDLDCKLRQLVQKAARYVSVWMLVFISVERAVSVKLPLKIKSICTLKLARCLVVVVWILAFALAALNASLIIFLSEVTGDECYVGIQETRYLYYVELFLYTALSMVIPYPIILVCTIITISALLQNVIRKSKSNKRQMKSITLTFVFVNLIYIISVSPEVTLEIYMLVRLRFNDSFRWTFESYFNFINLMNLFSFISFIHHTVNFFIYFLSGSRFRTETKDLFVSLFRKNTSKW